MELDRLNVTYWYPHPLGGDATGRSGSGLGVALPLGGATGRSRSRSADASPLSRDTSLLSDR